MDTPKRTWVKALCWQLLGLVTMSAVGYGFTGSMRVGGVMAMANAAVGLMTYIGYERLWARIGWGRKGA
ncbi:DUF2061 domain-containing protein [Profundibacter sp.]|uniref:DUF2061 domain-containing protein n=1 Tax=Profundibacter sp. TaxID=3101071 RepID=UPI003D13E5EE